MAKEAVIPEAEEIKTEYMRLDEIKMPLRNPKGHNLGELSDSIGRFGYIMPVVINERTGRLVAGKGRYDALVSAKIAGKNPPRRIRVDRDGMWMMPVVRGISFETDAEAEAYVLADNRLTELGGMDNEAMLLDMLVDLKSEGDEMLKGVGYDGEDIDELWKRVHGDESGGSEKGADREEADANRDMKAEEIQAILKKWGVEVGDVWRVGGHILVCGDCKERSSWSAAHHKINGVMTSPPYAEQRKGEYGGIAEGEYVDWWEGVQARVMEKLADDGSFFVNIKPDADGGERKLYVMKLVIAMKEQWGWKYIDEFCWERHGAPGSWPNRFKNGFEPVHQFSKLTSIKFRPDNVARDEAGRSTSIGSGNMGSYYNNMDVEWSNARPSNRIPEAGSVVGYGHEAAFPYQLPEFFIRAFSDEGDLWCDPFMGSGSTIVACEISERVGYGIEKKPEYCAIAIERLTSEFGLEAAKVQ